MKRYGYYKIFFSECGKEFYQCNIYTNNGLIRKNKKLQFQ